MRKVVGLPTVFLLLWSLSANAEPNETAQRFLTDTPTMMDWGLMRLQDQLRSYQDGEDLRVDYDPEGNRILIVRLVVARHGESLDFEEDCRQWTLMMRYRANIFDGKVPPGLLFSEFAWPFAHFGGSDRIIEGQTEHEALAELDRLFVLETTYIRNPQEGYVPAVEMVCTADLIGTSITIQP